MMKGYQDSMYQEGLEDGIWELQSPWLPSGLTCNINILVEWSDGILEHPCGTEGTVVCGLLLETEGLLNRQ